MADLKIGMDLYIPKIRIDLEKETLFQQENQNLLLSQDFTTETKTLIDEENQVLICEYRIYNILQKGGGYIPYKRKALNHCIIAHACLKTYCYIDKEDNIIFIFVIHIECDLKKDLITQNVILQDQKEYCTVQVENKYMYNAKKPQDLIQLIEQLKDWIKREAKIQFGFGKPVLKKCEL